MSGFKKHDLQETLVSLYLRLNGYFVSGFIVHAPGMNNESNRTQVDALGIRLPNNSEPEREVQPSEYLQLPTRQIDILICEVKGGKASLQFNEALRSSHSIQSVLRWIGAFDDKEVDTLLKPVSDILSPHDPDTPTAFHSVAVPGSMYQVRAMLFALDRPAPRNNQTRYVFGEEVIGFTNKCLRAKIRRDQCTTQYDFRLWGPLYEPIVRLVKEADHDLTLREIYEALLSKDAEER